MGLWDCTQVTRLVLQTPVPTELFHWLHNFLYIMKLQPQRNSSSMARVTQLLCSSGEVFRQDDFRVIILEYTLHKAILENPSSFLWNGDFLCQDIITDVCWSMCASALAVLLNHRSSSFYHPCLQETHLTGEGKAYIVMVFCCYTEY